jgi:hypothetical protein
MKTITIIAATNTRINEHAIAIDRTAKNVPHQVSQLLFSPEQPTVPFSGEWQRNLAWMPNGHWTIQDYSRFILWGLADFIKSDICIIVQWDGYGVNPDRWTDEFLEYDYIGAPWPVALTKGLCRVGNGGFSLRSKRWLDAGKAIASSYNGEAEDVFCCQKYVKHYLDCGCQLAPIDLALQFSIEHSLPDYRGWSASQSFGFHSWFNAEREKYRIQLDHHPQIRMD